MKTIEKPFAPKVNIKSKTRRNYTGCSGIKDKWLTIKQTSSNLTLAKTAAWCHVQLCSSHVTHIQKQRGTGKYIITTKVYPKSLSEWKTVYTFFYNVALKQATENGHYTTALRIIKIIRQLGLEL